MFLCFQYTGTTKQFSWKTEYWKAFQRYLLELGFLLHSCKYGRYKYTFFSQCIGGNTEGQRILVLLGHIYFLNVSILRACCSRPCFGTIAKIRQSPTSESSYGESVVNQSPKNHSWLCPWNAPKLMTYFTNRTKFCSHNDHRLNDLLCHPVKCQFSSQVTLFFVS